MLVKSLKLMVILLVVSLAAACSRQTSAPQQLGTLNQGKGDFADLTLPLSKIGSKKSQSFTFNASGGLKIELKTPEGRAYARLKLSWDGGELETKTLDEPSIEHKPDSELSTTYTLTVMNRSTKSKYDIVNATLLITSLDSGVEPESKVPDKRRSLEGYRCPEGDSPIAVLFFDADSTLRVSRTGTPSANHSADVYVLPFVASKIAEMNRDGILVAIVSNQGGVARGYITLEEAQDALVFTATQIARLGGRVDYLDFADDYDDNRKPETGMATRLEELLNARCGRGIDWSKTVMVGDAGYKKDVDGPHPDGRPADDFSNSDRGFAEKLQIPFHEPTDYFGWREYGVFNLHSKYQLFNMLEKLEGRIAELQTSADDPDTLQILKQEVDALREVNELPAPD